MLPAAAGDLPGVKTWPFIFSKEVDRGFEKAPETRECNHRKRKDGIKENKTKEKNQKMKKNRQRVDVSQDTIGAAGTKMPTIGLIRTNTKEYRRVSSKWALRYEKPKCGGGNLPGQIGANGETAIKMGLGPGHRRRLFFLEMQTA